MPSCCATRRASSTSATEQQPESDCPPQSLSVAPTTSCPRSTRRAAATEESTPPDMATNTRTGPVCHPFSGGMSQGGDHARDGGQGALDVRLGGVVAEG